MSDLSTEVAELRERIQRLEARLGTPATAISPPPAGSPTGAEVVAAVQELAAATGAPPTVDGWNCWPPRPCESKTASRRVAGEFGGSATWTNTLRVAGFDRRSEEVERRSSIPTTEREQPESRLERANRVLDAVRKMAGEQGSAPTQVSWNVWPGRTCEYKSATKWVAEAFGVPPQWAQVLKLAGIDPDRAQRTVWKDDECVAALKEYRDRNSGETPTAAEWDAAARCSDSTPSSSALSARFGTWGKALESAGMVPRATGQTKASEVKKATRLGRNRQMVTAGVSDVKPQRWDRAATVESIRVNP